MLTIETPPTLFSPAKAAKVAAEMNAGEEEGWSYTVCHGPPGSFSRVHITDEAGEHVGYV